MSGPYSPRKTKLTHEQALREIDRLRDIVRRQRYALRKIEGAAAAILAYRNDDGQERVKPVSERVLNLIREQGPQTAQDIATALGWKIGYARNHISGMRRKGLLKYTRLPTGERLWSLPC